MGTLSWLNVGTLERALTPLLGKLVKCSAHGYSFVRLQYLKNPPHSSLVWGSLRFTPITVPFEVCQVRKLSSCIHVVLFGYLIGSAIQGLQLSLQMTIVGKDEDEMTFSAKKWSVQ